MNIMRHKFTVREIVLLVILFVVLAVGLYFWLIYYPLQNKVADLESAKEEVEFDNEIADARLVLYNKMQAEIREIEKIPEDERTQMVPYTEEEKAKIMFDVYNIFGEESRNFDYSTKIENGIVQYSIRFTFSLDVQEGEDPVVPYSRGKDMLRALMNTGRRSQIGNLTVQPKSGNIATDGITVNGTVTFFELEV